MSVIMGIEEKNYNIKKYQAMDNYIKTKINITEPPNFMLNYIGDILNELKKEKPYLIGIVRNLKDEIEKLPNEEEKQKLLKMINSKYNEMPVTSPISHTAVTYLNPPPTPTMPVSSSVLVDTSEFKPIGLSTRDGGYIEGEPSWMNINFGKILKNKIQEL